MPQPHKNLFFYYRGASSRSDQPNHVFDRQLEDNTTKALIYVLENSDRKVVLGPFLRELAGLKRTLALNETQFALQRVDISRPTVQQRIAISIAPHPEPLMRSQDGHATGRPDAWIWIDEEFSLLIETKVRGAPNLDQINRHIDGAEGWRENPVDRVTASWAQVYALFHRIRQESTNAEPTTRLLLTEFLRYLRMMGLGSDTTFDLDDFGFFLLKPEDRDDAVRALLTRKLTHFTEQLIETDALKSVVRSYEVSGQAAVNPGIFRKASSNFWITIGPKERRDRCHFTIRLSEEGIALEAFSPHRSFTTRLIEKIETKSAEFIKAIAPLQSGPYLFRLREAIYSDPDSSYKGQRISHWLDYLQIHPSVLTKSNLATLIIEPIRQRLEMNELRPELFLVRQFTLSELVGNSNIVKDVAAAAKPMLPYLRFALTL